MVAILGKASPAFAAGIGLTSAVPSLLPQLQILGLGIAMGMSKWVAVAPVMYVICSINEYVTHRYF